MTAVAGVPDEPTVAAFLASLVEVDPGGAPVEPAAVVQAVAAAQLPPGAPVLIAMPNGRAQLAAFFAVLLTGGVPALLPPASTAARLREIGRRLGAAALIAPRIDPDRYGESPPLPLGCAELMPLTPAEQAARHRRGQVILMTSGTAGIASGCLHDFAALLRTAARHADAIGQRPGDTVLVTVPLYYSYGLVAQALTALLRGSRLVVAGPPFTPAGYGRTVRDFGADVSSLTPVHVAALGGDHRALQPLRVLTVGGDQLPASRVGALLGAVRELYVTYGLSEAGPRVATLAAHREPPHRHGSVGHPLPGVRTRLVPAGEGGAGQLVVESDTVMLRRLPAGAPDPLLAAGVVATGDLFDIDDDGYHFFRGRLSDSVVVDGEKVWLPSVRAVARSLDGVVHASTDVYHDDAGARRYALCVHIEDTKIRQARAVETALRRLLLRAEQPHRITVRPASELDRLK